MKRMIRKDRDLFQYYLKKNFLYRSWKNAWKIALLLVCATDHVFVLYQWTMVKAIWSHCLRLPILALKRSFLEPSALDSCFALAALSVNIGPSLWQRLHCYLNDEIKHNLAHVSPKGFCTACNQEDRRSCLERSGAQDMRWISCLLWRG